MTFQFSIPGPAEAIDVSVEPGSSVVFVGANGGGKTRLAAWLEDNLKLAAHRISAHRALVLNPTVAKISEIEALKGLRLGNVSNNVQIAHRTGFRWNNNSAVALLNDFDFLIQALFADQSNKALETHKRVRSGDSGPADATKFERLVEMWERLLPHRKLHVSGDNIQVSVDESEQRYLASDMSDGERAIFYLIGQTLAAEKGSLLIFDEPELHVHRSIMSKLWDELEGARPDCAFVFITHDLEFAASRVAQKFVIRDFDPTPQWTLEPVPEDTGFDEELTTLILGSRRPILFVEGSETSLDSAVYRCCFPGWTVIPRGSCEEVIHSVVTMRRNASLTRLTCSGLVDADDHQPDDVAYLGALGVSILSVSEIENLILLPDVSRAIVESEGHVGAELERQLEALKTAIFGTLDRPELIDAVVARYCRRRIDRVLKRIDLSSAGTVADIATEYARQTAALDVPQIAEAARARIHDALRDGDLPALLANCDNKGLIALAAIHLKRMRLADFESWLTRVLRNNTVPALTAAVRKSLPEIQAQ